ncbi:MAG: hypothetical protein V2J55_17790, partial [Candidatus Competibacteraceae bacterium]|nr:hypothetical protein [Candidatus Competibacteraceae bacterium]
MLSLIEELLSGVALRWKGRMTDWCDLESGFNDSNYLLTVPGGCVSALRIEGLTRLYDNAEIPEVFRQLWPALASTSALHDVELVTIRDPERGQQVVKHNDRRLALRATQAGIAELERLTDDWHAGPWLDEAVYAAVWTHPRVLTRTEQRRDDQRYRARLRAGGDFRHTQHPFRAYEQLIHSHQAALATFATQLQHAHLSVTPLTGAALLRVLKHQINPHQAHGSGWQPQLIGDPIGGAADFPGPAALLWLPLRDQLFDLDGDRFNRTLAKVGDRYYASVQMTLLPRRNDRFSALRIDSDVPWRIRFLISRWSLATKLLYTLNQFLAGVMNWPTHERNNLIKRATHELQPLIEADETRVMRVVATTWGDSEQAIRLRFEKLISGLQHWGLATVKPIQDDPIEGVMSSLPGLRAGSAWAPLIAPKHYVTILPVDTPASVFSSGLLLRTPQGRPWFYEPLSDRQASWVTLYTGLPGQGKSVMMAAENLTLLCQPGELPYFSHIELYPSARGLFRLLRALAEPAVKPLLLYRRLRASNDDAINPFSTFLGCNEPLPYHREGLILILLCLSYSFDATAPEKNTT